MKYILRALGLAFGALIYTIGLDVFLVPNHVIDGGVVGIALMAAQLTGISFSSRITNYSCIVNSRTRSIIY